MRIIIVLRKTLLKKAYELGYDLNESAFDRTNPFMILDPESMLIESTSSKKFWGSSDFKSMLDDDFLRLPVPALKGDTCVERTDGNDFTVFVVAQVNTGTYVSEDGIDYPKNKCSRVTPEVAKKVRKILLGVA